MFIFSSISEFSCSASLEGSALPSPPTKICELPFCSLRWWRESRGICALNRALQVHLLQVHEVTPGDKHWTTDVTRAHKFSTSKGPPTFLFQTYFSCLPPRLIRKGLHCPVLTPAIPFQPSLAPYSACSLAVLFLKCFFDDAVSFALSHLFPKGYHFFEDPPPVLHRQSSPPSSL